MSSWEADSSSASPSRLQVEPVHDFVDGASITCDVIGDAYALAAHAELLEHALRADVAQLGRGPYPHESERVDRRSHRGSRSLRRDTAPPPRAPDRVAD